MQIRLTTEKRVKNPFFWNETNQPLQKTQRLTDWENSVNVLKRVDTVDKMG